MGDGYQRMKTLLCLLLLCSCASERQMGRDAASAMGAGGYVEFQRDGKPDTASIFYWRGQWRLYYPSFGTEATLLCDQDKMPLESVLVIPGSSGPIQWKPVQTTEVDLPKTWGNCCTPIAIQDSRLHGGWIAVTKNHAEHFNP